MMAREGSRPLGIGQNWAEKKNGSVECRTKGTPWEDRKMEAKNRITYDTKEEIHQRNETNNNNKNAAKKDKKNHVQGAKNKSHAKNQNATSKSGGKNKNKSTMSTKTKTSEILFDAENPFTLPNDNDLYHLAQPRSADDDDEEEEEEREEAERRKRKMMEKKKNLRAHEKTTYISRMNATNTQIVKVRVEGIEERRNLGIWRLKSLVW